MAKSKYPGFQILYEIGTRAELAESYGVSERTMYRWLNKAKAETAPKRQSYPGAEAIANFKGTRKELAQTFGISERTAYRWLNKAKAQGANIPSRQRVSQYPGMDILSEQGSNVAIGKRYGVSEATVRRWKKIAAAGMPEEVFTPDQLPEEVFTPDQLTEEITFEEPEQEEQPEQEEGPNLDNEYEEFSDEDKEQIKILRDLLLDSDQFAEDSAFLGLDLETQQKYLMAYIAYQNDMDPGRFYNKEIHDFDYSPEFVSTINMWGDEFESWLSMMRDLEEYRASNQRPKNTLDILDEL